ncbi:hypothetical protein [Methanobrevibacter sp.]|uniref:hypothetical protein n=1 Tax=Methanobrevibacter sp. TaxID=66852 RepID=UPI00386E29D0
MTTFRRSPKEFVKLEQKRKELKKQDIISRRKRRNENMNNSKETLTIGNFLDAFEKFVRICITNNKPTNLLRQYAQKVKNSKGMTTESINYANAILDFLNSLKNGDFNLNRVGTLLNANEWERFCIGALHEVRKEYLFDDCKLQLI